MPCLLCDWDFFFEISINPIWLSSEETSLKKSYFIFSCLSFFSPKNLAFILKPLMQQVQCVLLICTIFKESFAWNFTKICCNTWNKINIAISRNFYLLTKMHDDARLIFFRIRLYHRYVKQSEKIRFPLCIYLLQKGESNKW